MTAEARALAIRTHFRDLMLDGRPPCQVLGPGMFVLLTEHLRAILRTPELDFGDD